jgi:hypothetical protein
MFLPDLHICPFSALASAFLSRSAPEILVSTGPSPVMIFPYSIKRVKARRCGD